jgi:AraC-like DNA-binding protein
VAYYRELPLAPRFRSLVAGIWAFPTHEHAHRILPDGCMDIVFLDGRARLVGAMRTAASVPPRFDATLGVRLRPGEADRIFPGLPGELTDDEALLAELWGDAGRALEDAILSRLERATRDRADAAAILRGAIPIVEHALSARLATRADPSDLRMRAAAALLDQGRSVADVANAIDLSARQLGRRFEARVGLGPKTFARVRRLQRASLLLRRGEPVSRAAVLAGYADQPHFTREASALAGTTPIGLAAELTDGVDTSVPVVL